MALNAKLIGCVSDDRALLGESPVWDERDSCLYWLDIKGRKMFCYSPANDSTLSAFNGSEISAIAPAKKGGFIVAGVSGFSYVEFKGDYIILEPITDPETDLPENRFNDGKIDPAGGFWAGTMDNAEQAATGSWWRLAPDGETTKLTSGFKITNGPAFDRVGERVFLTDSARQIVSVGKTDGVTVDGLLPFLEFGTNDGYPDGMEVDCEGCLWIAFWDGWCVRRFSPQGELLLQIDLPVPRPTSVAIAKGGIYVSSAKIGLDEAVLRRAPQSGGLFFVETDKDLRATDPMPMFG